MILTPTPPAPLHLTTSKTLIRHRNRQIRPLRNPTPSHLTNSRRLRPRHNTRLRLHARRAIPDTLWQGLSRRIVHFDSLRVVFGIAGAHGVGSLRVPAAGFVGFECAGFVGRVF